MRATITLDVSYNKRKAVGAWGMAEDEPYPFDELLRDFASFLQHDDDLKEWFKGLTVRKVTATVK
jgi:hypothetical protein